jgi:hypothetical protein
MQRKIMTPDDEDDSGDEVVRVEKRKADTDHMNPMFTQSLRERDTSQKRNWIHEHMNLVKSMNTGRPLKQRIDLPEGFEYSPYGNQKMNIWEFQKEQLRKRIADDKGNFYSYSKEHLSLAFPLINENEIKVKEKEANEARWKT